MNLQEAILNAVDDLSRRPGGPVRLAELRRNLPDDCTHDQVTSALLFLNDRRMVALESDPDRRGLTDEDRAAAVELGGRARHLVRVVQ